MIRADDEEKQAQIESLERLHRHHEERAKRALFEVQSAAVRDDNVFDALMEATKVCSLGQLTEALFQVGGQYRRNM